jgi:membrane protein
VTPPPAPRAPRAWRNLTGWARARVYGLLDGAGLPERLRPAIVVVRFGWLLYRRMVADRAFLRAAGMAYATLMALVPVLLLLFGALGASGVLAQDRAAVEDLVFGSFLGNIPEVRSFLLPGLMGVDLGTMGLVGIGGLAFVAARLYIQVEVAYCDIFGVEVDRPLYWRLLMFYAAVTLAPVLGVTTFLQSGRLAGLFGVGMTTQFTVAAMQFGVLLAAMLGFPTKAVRWWPAMAGSAVSLVLLQTFSAGFEAYLVLFAVDDPVRVIYGSVGVIPVFLLWMYLAWLSVLIGVEVAAVSQDFDAMFKVAYAEVLQQHADVTLPGVDTALLVAAQVAAWFEAGRGPVDRDALAETVGLRGGDAAVVLRALESAGLVARVGEGWLLARPAASIPLREVAAAWRGRTSPHPDDDGRVGLVRAELDAALVGTLADAARRWGGTGAPAPPLTVEGT